ncbi:hypothetical protein ACFORH_27230 [Amycolatopsis roodepoortensis]|uniref:Uncharacterized protein n=1 Tax=Amycolatopsis roodepoortensis TaxID=700274 RepID=A0ABR9LIY6_9PSEU|nr:hypothetical protein [Amycolatopsis roodepoortensis]MBE1580656.1 hypothetical protein [Amycolatopsis roodepoortensis]
MRRQNGRRGFRTRPFLAALVILAGFAAGSLVRGRGHSPQSVMGYGLVAATATSTLAGRRTLASGLRDDPDGPYGMATEVAAAAIKNLKKS